MLKTNENKGITLIALVVTIIVLIILAGVTLNMLLNENGIIEKTKQAKEQTLIAQYKEQIELVKAETILQYEDGLTLTRLKSAFDDNSKKDWVNNTEIQNEIIKLTTNDGYVFFITEETTEYKGTGDIIIPEIVTAEMVQFTPTDTTWKATNGEDITTVEQALDSLYTQFKI